MTDLYTGFHLHHGTSSEAQGDGASSSDIPIRAMLLINAEQNTEGVVSFRHAP